MSASEMYLILFTVVKYPQRNTPLALEPHIKQGRPTHRHRPCAPRLSARRMLSAPGSASPLRLALIIDATLHIICKILMEIIFLGSFYRQARQFWQHCANI